MSIEGVAIQTEPENDGTPSITRFFIENGRLPFVDDPVKPWHYRGWLMPYRVMMESHPDVPSRYDYVMRTLENGKLLDEPIPQMRFVSEGGREAEPGRKMLASMVATVERATGYHRALEQVAEWLAFAIGISDRPSELGDREQEDLYRAFDLSKWLLAPADYLGEMMAENGHGKAAGFFPTPMAICTMMAMMSHSDGRDHRHEMAMDPAVGTGRTLLAASNYSLRLFGMDINYLCVLVCKVNLALYAPWFHIPESFFPAISREKTVVEPQNAEKAASGEGIGQNGPLLQRSGSPKRAFTTEIEQPTLFGME